MDQELKDVFSKLEKQYGHVSTVDPTVKQVIDTIPTGILSVDRALGVGGFPRGRISEIFGPESSGKTSLIWSLIAEVHKRGGLAFLVDMEHAADLSWAQLLGVDLSLLKIIQPDSLEEALDYTEELTRTGLFSAGVIDSVASLVPRKEAEGTMEESTIGLVPRLLGKSLRKLTPVAAKTNTAIIFINQLRINVGAYGNPEITPGGKALKYAASIRMSMRSPDGDALKDGKEMIGRKVNIKVVKNKLAAPFQEASFELFFDSGISKIGATFDVAVELGIIKKGGAWYTWGEERFQGGQAVKDFLQGNPNKLEELIGAIKATEE